MLKSAGSVAVYTKTELIRRLLFDYSNMRQLQAFIKRGGTMPPSSKQ